MLDPDPRNVFPKTCLMIKPVLCGREKTSVDFIRPKSDPLSPEKNQQRKMPSPLPICIDSMRKYLDSRLVTLSPDKLC